VRSWLAEENHCPVTEPGTSSDILQAGIQFVTKQNGKERRVRCKVAGRAVPKTDWKTRLQENQICSKSDEIKSRGEAECPGNSGHCSRHRGHPCLRPQCLCVLLPQSEHRARPGRGCGLAHQLLGEGSLGGKTWTTTGHKSLPPFPPCDRPPDWP
ncbi:hypothetical protein COCON_G00127620, partial [Conger conger]